MADNVLVDNGSGTDYTVSTDDAGASGQVQRVKLAYSADGSATHVQADVDGVLVNLGANNDVSVTGSVALAAGTNTNEVVGDVAEDQPIAGNPVRVGGRASQARPTAMSTNGDVVSPWYDLSGALHTIPGAATTATLSSVSSSATNVTLLSSSSSRKGVIVHNNSTQIAYIKYGTTATSSTGGYTYKVPADATWEMPNPIYTGQIDVIWASANGAASVTELT